MSLTITVLGRGPVVRPQTGLRIEVLGLGPVVRPQPGEGCDYRLCGSIAELRDYLRPALDDHTAFGADWEATSLNTLTARPVGLGVSVGPKSGRYVPVGHLIEPEANLPLPEVLQVLQDCDRAGAPSIWFNAIGYDFGLMETNFHWVPTRWGDSYIGVFLVDSNVRELGLKVSALRFTGTRMLELADLDTEWITLSRTARKGRAPKLPHEHPPAVVAPYGSADADLARRLWVDRRVQQALADQPQIARLEARLAAGIRAGHRTGVCLDRDRLVAMEAEVTAQLAALDPQIQQHFTDAGLPPVKLSRKQVLAAQLLQLPPTDRRAGAQLAEVIAERTDTGRGTVSVKVLDRYRTAHPIIPRLIEYAQLLAQRDNYLVKLRKAVDYFSAQPWAGGRVRFAFSTIGVPTGRMKCGGSGRGAEAYLKGVADVNAQSIPDAEKAAYLPNTRAAFVAPPGFYLVALDFNQIELRIPANLSGEPSWVQTFLSGGDIHLTNAQAIANVREPGVRVTKDDKARRSKAKPVSFCLPYGGDEHTVARNAGIPVSEAKAIVEAFFTGLPHIRTLMQSLKDSAKTLGYATTILGRRRPLAQYFPPEPSRDQGKRAWIAWKRRVEAGEREALNHPIQGGAADLFKTACIRVVDALAREGWDETVCTPPVLWVHDELVVYVAEAALESVVPILLRAMEVPVQHWPVPLTVTAEVGHRYLALDKAAEQASLQGDEPLAQSLRAQQATVPPESTGQESTWGDLVPYRLVCQHRAQQRPARVA